MKGYIVSVIGVCIVGTVVSVISPNGESGGISKHIRLIIAVCVVSVCINPVFDAVNYINDINFDGLIENDGKTESDYKDMFENSYSAAEINNLKVGIKQLLYDEFGVDGAECSVSVSLSNESGKISRIFITLYGSAMFENTGEIENYFGDLFDCEIVTAIG